MVGVGGSEPRGVERVGFLRLDLTGPAHPCKQLRAVVHRSQASIVACDASAVPADFDGLDVVARLELTAHRMGVRLRLHDAPERLIDLVDLAGLGSVIEFVLSPAGSAERPPRGARTRTSPQTRSQRTAMCDLTSTIAIQAAVTTPQQVTSSGRGCRVGAFACRPAQADVAAATFRSRRSHSDGSNGRVRRSDR